MYFTIGQRAPLPNVTPLQRGVYKYHHIFRGKGWNARSEGGGVACSELASSETVDQLW